MATVNAILEDESISHAVSLQQYSLGVVRRMIALLNRADAELSAALMTALQDMPPESFTVERLESLLGSVRTINAAAYAQVAQELNKDLQELAGYEAEWQYNLFNSTIPEPVLVRFPIASVTSDQVYDAAMSRPFQGRLLRDWAKNIEADRMAKVRNAVRQGYIEGKTTADIVRSIRGTRSAGYADGFLQRPRKDLEAVVRTAISHTASTARAEFTKANADIIKAEKWVSTLDTKTSEQCFPASTTAFSVGDLRGVTRRLYEGEMIVVTTAAGKELRATPNHPVLTARGWRAIKELNPGHDVLYQAVGDFGDVSSAKKVSVPTTIGAIADALLHPAVGDVLVERSAQTDFHGDGMSGDYEVDVSGANGDLRLAFESAHGKKVSDEFFARIAFPGQFSARCNHGLLLVGDGPRFMAAEVDSVSFGNRVEAEPTDAGSPDYFRRCLTIDKELDNCGFISPAGVVAATKVRHYACAFEDSGNSRSGDAIAFSNATCGGAIGVLADDVVAVRSELFSGHVYNLSTGSEFYIADGFVVHNCRIRDNKQYTAIDHKPIGHKVPWLQGPGRLHWNCRSTETPVTKSWRELGIDVDSMTPGQRASMDGQVPADQDYNTWLSKQSAARQERVLGPERYQLVKSGQVTMDQLYSPNGKFLTIAQLKEIDGVEMPRRAA